jgi:hypothetical protein
MWARSTVWSRFSAKLTFQQVVNNKAKVFLSLIYLVPVFACGWEIALA